MSIIPLSENPRGANLIIVETIFLFLGIVAVAGRLWSRQIQHKSLEFNDYSIIVALIIMIARYGNEVAMVVVAGFGLHVSVIEAEYGPDKIITFGKMSFADDLMWVSLITIIKLSVLDVCARIFRQPTFVLIERIVFAIVAISGVAYLLTTALICRPVALNWDYTLPGTCGNKHTMYLSLASVDLVLDLLVVFLPMPVVWTLQLATSKKVAISIVFGIGAAICCITAIRLKFINEINVLDLQYSQIKFNVFAALEPLLGIISACLPVLPPVFRKYSRSAAFQTAIKKAAANGYSGGASELKNFGSRKGTGMVSSAYSGRPFDRLDDEYPLKDEENSLESEASKYPGNIVVSTQVDLEYASSKSRDSDIPSKTPGLAC